MLKNIFILSILLAINLPSLQANEKSAPAPGQVIVEFSSADSINLYVFMAKRIIVLNELSKYLDIELFTSGLSNNEISLNVQQQSLSWIFDKLLQDQNYILRYDVKLTKPKQQSKVRVHQTQSASNIDHFDHPKISDTTNSKLKTVNDRTQLLENLESLGDFKTTASIKQISTLTHFETIEQKLTLIESLGDIGDADAVRLLARFINDDSIDVREAAIYALGDISSIATTQILGEIINDPDPELSDLAISELVLISSDHAVGSLVRSFNQQDIDTQTKLQQALALINTPAARTQLWKMVDARHSRISITAYELLSQTLVSIDN